MLELIALRSRMQGEGIIEQVSCVYISICKRKILLGIFMSSIICVCFSQLVDHHVRKAYVPQ